MSNNLYLLTPNGQLVVVDELYHHGVKGQKWGVRRYQNKDGTLTEAGKKRVRESGGLGFPKRDGKKTSIENRLVATYADNSAKQKYRETYIKEREHLLNDHEALRKAGYILKNKLDSNEREHNSDLLVALLDKNPAVKEAERAVCDAFVEQYASATLRDLGLQVTPQAKEYTKEYLSERGVYPNI